MSKKNAAARGRTGHAAAVNERTDPPHNTTARGIIQIRPQFSQPLSSAIDLLVDLEELGSPIARSLRAQLERYIPA